MTNESYISYKRFAFLLIFIGCFLALDYVAKLHFVHKLWPIILTSEGVGLVIIYNHSKDGKILFLVIGEYLILFSILALYCNFYSWIKLSTLWPLFISFFGINFITVFFIQKKNRFILFLGLFLLLLSLFFFLLIFFGSHIWFLIFILIGLSILITIKRK